MIQNVETGRMEFFNDPIKYGIQKIVKFKDTNKLKDRKRYNTNSMQKKSWRDYTNKRQSFKKKLLLDWRNIL